MLDDRTADLVLDRRQEGGRKHTFNAATIDRQDAPHAVSPQRTA
jgi:hypothetical protein